MLVGHLIINTTFHGLTVTSVITELRAVFRAQKNMKAYRLMRNRMIVILSFDFHIASTSKGSVRKNSYAYQASSSSRMSNPLGVIKLRLAQCCDIDIVR